MDEGITAVFVELIDTEECRREAKYSKLVNSHESGK